jgi:hypothetical protein
MPINMRSGNTFKQPGTIMIKTYLLWAFLAALILYTPVTWVTNLVKLTDCDFVAPYKCEVVHAAGIIPLVAWVTAWMDNPEVAE